MIGERSGRTTGEDELRVAFEAHYSALIRMSILVAGDPHVAEDLVQEASVRAAGSVSRLSSDDVRAYLRATILNLWRNRLRRLSVERRARLRSEASTPIPFEERDAVWRTVLGLPSRQRACLVLRYYEELTERETAEVLRCSVGTVKSQTSRALDRLQQELREEELRDED